VSVPVIALREPRLTMSQGADPQCPIVPPSSKMQGIIIGQLG
jgi:hypothetical protein